MRILLGFESEVDRAGARGSVAADLAVIPQELRAPGRDLQGLGRRPRLLQIAHVAARVQRRKFQASILVGTAIGETGFAIFIAQGDGERCASLVRQGFLVRLDAAACGYQECGGGNEGNWIDVLHDLWLG